MADARASAADARVLGLVRDYAQLSGGGLEQLEHDLYQLSIPRGDERLFDGRTAIRIAFSVDALELDDRAEMAIVGSNFVASLIDAVRTRGARLIAGDVVPPRLTAPETPNLPIPMKAGEVRNSQFELARHRVGRLTARVVVRAGTEIRERLAASGMYDLCSGLPLPPDVAQACAAATPLAAQDVESWGSIPSPATLPMPQLIARMLQDLEGSLRPEIEQVGSKATGALAHELDRINRYYAAVLDDIGGRGTGIPDAATRRDIEAEHRRRADEESERHRVRAVVHPVQMTEWTIAVQRATWKLSSPTGHTGTLVAQRPLAGRQEWSVGCEACGATKTAWVAVCVHDHVGCSTCTAECAVCNDTFCRHHGTACHVDGRSVCDTHARTCHSCRREHCATHEGICDDGGHGACSSCLAPCAACGRDICESHALKSTADAPRGPRRFCHACAMYCEGGTGEIVGPDEVADCASCSRVVCQRHQARCDVDGKVHCSKHLRRTDRSRRLVCEADRTVCSHEPNSVFAGDELATCASCGRVGCDQHVLECIGDLRRHCAEHLKVVRDRPGALACPQHQSQCHVDGAVFTVAGTRPCPCCGRTTCREHTRECTNCKRLVCAQDFDDQKPKVCATCGKLEPVAQPSDAILFAAIELRGDDAGAPRAWKIARDARHMLAELELGWTRRIVMAVAHGEQRAQHAVSHSAIGSKILR